MHNLQSVIEQLRASGLQVDVPHIGRLSRCRVAGDREKRGWYILHEITARDGRRIIVGAYGIWRGDDPGTKKIQIERDRLDPEQWRALKERMRRDQKRLKEEKIRAAEKAARRAQRAWARAQPCTEHDYLSRKAVQSHGLRCLDGKLLVPMMDVRATVRGLQVIYSRAEHGAQIKKLGRDKSYWPPGLAKKGLHYLIGMPRGVGIVAEGYATAATLYEATGLAVAVAFDAANLLEVSRVLAHRYRTVRWIIAADDDDLARCRRCAQPVRVSGGRECPHCGEPHGRRNTGVTAAEAAALAVDGAVAIPRWEEDENRWRRFLEGGVKRTDFNDLYLDEGLSSVRRLIEEVIGARGWRATRTVGQESDETSAGLTPLHSLDELLERFSLVYGRGGMVFDHREHVLISLSDMRDACVRRELHRAWMEHEERRIVRPNQVGFDPSGNDPNVHCNLWAGWPTRPEPGCCERLLELLQYMCNGEGRGEELYRWVLRWLAYPIQHPGAKMRTALVVHGPQGTGKNLFFESILDIYGPYGRIIDQAAVEDKFNDWASRKLFLIADEVVARSELWHVKNRLKGFITGDWIRINPKNMAAYEERNHVNMVFLSNERVPTALEPDDRRHCVIWTPRNLPASFYDEVAEEIRAGGVAALHHYLLHLELDGFGPHTKPPMTEAKRDLIGLSMDSTARFREALHEEFTELVAVPMPSELLYRLYRRWCERNGYRAANSTRFIDGVCKLPLAPWRRVRKRYMTPSGKVRQATFVWPDGVQVPDGISERDWLGECAGRMRQLIDDYSEGLDV